MDIRDIRDCRDITEITLKKALTLYHAIPTLNDPEKKAWENTVGKGEKTGNQHFPLFPVFSTLSKREIVTLASFDLSSANVFNLVRSKIVPFGKGLNSFPFNQFHPGDLGTSFMR